jgi:hypothetical protein
VGLDAAGIERAVRRALEAQAAGATA